MARRAKISLADIEQQIESLQLQAAKLREEEVAGVIDRIKTAIAHYGLTAEQLGFGGSRRSLKVRGAPPVKRETASTSKKLRGAAKPAGVAKYGNGEGKTWTGVGKRPGWFKDAIAAGKAPEDLLLARPAS